MPLAFSKQPRHIKETSAFCLLGLALLWAFEQWAGTGVAEHMEHILGQFPIAEIIGVPASLLRRYPLTTFSLCVMVFAFIKTYSRSDGPDLRGTVKASLSFGEGDLWLHLKVDCENYGRTEVTPRELAFTYIPRHGVPRTEYFSFSSRAILPIGPNGRMHDVIGFPYYDKSEISGAPQKLKAYVVDSLSVHHELKCSPENKDQWYPVRTI